MPAFVGPNIKVETWVMLPESAQLGQNPISTAPTTLNQGFLNSIHVTDSRQVLVLGPVGSRNSMVTAVYGQGEQHDQVYVYTGCFGGTLEAFEDAVVTRKQPGDPHRTQYELVITLLQRMLSYRGVPRVAPETFDSVWDGYGS